MSRLLVDLQLFSQLFFLLNFLWDLASGNFMEVRWRRGRERIGLSSEFCLYNWSIFCMVFVCFFVSSCFVWTLIVFIFFVFACFFACLCLFASFLSLFFACLFCLGLLFWKSFASFCGHRWLYSLTLDLASRKGWRLGRCSWQNDRPLQTDICKPQALSTWILDSLKAFFEHLDLDVQTNASAKNKQIFNLARNIAKPHCIFLLDTDNQTAPNPKLRKHHQHQEHKKKQKKKPPFPAKNSTTTSKTTKPGLLHLPIQLLVLMSLEVNQLQSAAHGGTCLSRFFRASSTGTARERTGEEVERPFWSSWVTEAKLSEKKKTIWYAWSPASNASRSCWGMVRSWGTSTASAAVLFSWCYPESWKIFKTNTCHLARFWLLAEAISWTKLSSTEAPKTFLKLLHLYLSSKQRRSLIARNTNKNTQ